MKVLFVSDSIWADGVVFDLHMLAEGLSLLGHTVHAIDPGELSGVGAVEQTPGGTEEVCRVFPGARVHVTSARYPAIRIAKLRVDTLTGVRFLYKSARRYRDIDRLVREHRYDVIVLYSAVHSGVQTVRIARKYGIPVAFRNVDMLHKLLPTRVGRSVAKRLERYVYPRVDLSLALTPKYADYLVGLGADPGKVELLLFPVDRGQFRPQPPDPELQARWNIALDDQVITWAGTIYPFSGLEAFIRRFPSVLAQTPNARLLIVGDGPLRPELQRAIAELNLSTRVTITGYQPFSDMPRYVNLATICLNVFPMTSTTSNLFSAKIIQYLACGKATASTALPGITTLIPGEQAGVVYAETVEGLAAMTSALLNDRSRRRTLEDAGLSYAAQSHGHDRILVRFEQLLKGLLAGTGRQVTTLAVQSV